LETQKVTAEKQRSIDFFMFDTLFVTQSPSCLQLNQD